MDTKNMTFTLKLIPSEDCRFHDGFACNFLNINLGTFTKWFRRTQFDTIESAKAEMDKRGDCFMLWSDSEGNWGEVNRDALKRL